MKLLIDWHMHLISVANASEQPIAKSSRARFQRQGASLRMANAIFAARRMAESDQFEKYKLLCIKNMESGQITPVFEFKFGLIQPYTVTLTRFGPRLLDSHDNLTAAFKNIVDGVCDALGIRDDSDISTVSFRYAQAKAKTKSIRIEVDGR